MQLQLGEAQVEVAVDERNTIFNGVMLVFIQIHLAI
jgi:hypothetical protein